MGRTHDGREIPEDSLLYSVIRWATLFVLDTTTKVAFILFFYLLFSVLRLSFKP